MKIQARGILLFVWLFAAGLSVCAAKYEVQKIEPPFWWAGMNNQQLQILVYGEDIADLTPEINYAGILLQKVVRVENPNYLFMYLKLDSGVKPGSFEISFMKNGKEQVGYKYELLPRVHGAADRVGFNPSDVMYLITPDRFVNGDPDNDNVEGMLETANRKFPGGRHGGDIQGIINSLDYLEEMGFTAIWVNPVLENDMHEYSYHGYAATDFYNVDRRFGTNEDYKKLSELAHQKGIKMIMDLILNHCGSEHWFVKDMPTSDWINFDGEYINTNHRRNTVQDIHASEYDKKHFSDGWFVKTMPDMNQRNELFANYLIQNSIWWIEYADLDGIRMDTYPYPDKEFMTEWTCAIMDEYPNFNIVGEEWVNNPAIVSYWQRGMDNHDGYVSCLPSLMDFPIQEALTKALNAEEKNYGSGMITLYEKLANDFLYADPYNLVIFPDNHDMDRFFTQVNGDFDLWKMGMAFNATMRGIPQFYYGTEILMSNTENKHDHGVIRSDFPGGWEGDPVNVFSGKGLSDMQVEAKDYLQKLLNWRKSSGVVHNGGLMHFAPEKGVYVYFRYSNSDVLMVVFNKNTEQVKLDVDRFEEMVSSCTSAADVITGEKFTLDNLTIEPRSVRVLELK